MHNNNPFFVRACFTSLLVWLLSIASSPANLIDETATTTLSYTDFSKDLLLPFFDPSLGHLQSVQLTVTGQLVGGGEYENANHSPSAASSVKYILDQDLAVTQGAQMYLSMSPTTTVTLPVPALPAFDGVLDYAGPSGASYQGINTTQVQTFTYNTPASLAPFIGAGKDNFHVAANADVMMSWSGLSGVWVGTYSKADVTIDLKYTYQPAPLAVPEPGLGQLLGLGAIGLVVARRFRQKKADVA